MLRDLDADTVDFEPNYDGSRSGAARPAGALPEPARQRLAAASPSAWRRTSRRTTCARRSPRRSPSSTTRTSTSTGLMQHMQGPGLPDRRRDPRPAAASATPTRPAAAASASAHARTSSRSAGQPRGDHRHRAALQVKKGGDGGVIEKIAELVNEKKLDRDLRRAGPLGPQRHAGRDRAQARREPEGRPQQALQAHADAVDVRREHGRAGRQRAAARCSLREVIHDYVRHQREVIVRRSKHELRDARAPRPPRSRAC